MRIFLNLSFFHIPLILYKNFLSFSGDHSLLSKELHRLFHTLYISCVVIDNCDHFFANQSDKALSDQAVRRMINKYTTLASIDLHITPHMFRHTFATSLLEADVDIRYIQEMLGHSSINITEIYTHVTVAKQREIETVSSFV